MTTAGGDDVAARRAIMAICAHAEAVDLAGAVKSLHCPVVEDLRVPETGLVMTTGRIGGDGRAFNLGEATVTRAAVRLADGRTGFAYHLGRDRRRARHAAILDALWQGEADRSAVETALAPLAAKAAGKAEREARRTAATRVDFLTLARGED